MSHFVKRLALALLAVSVSTAGCGTPATVRRAVASTAQRFGDAIGAGDGGKACGYLAPETRQELEQDQRAPCAKAILDDGLRGGASVSHAVVYGQQAMARLGNDTVFLSRFPSGWKVTAAGCEPQPGAPYQCQLKGG
jgi:hypothetical protein